MAELRVERAGAAAVITLDRPAKKNALSIALRDEITDALARLVPDESVKVVVFTGAGDTFCAGFDLSEFPRALEDDAYARTVRLGAHTGWIRCCGSLSPRSRR